MWSTILKRLLGFAGSSLFKYGMTGIITVILTIGGVWGAKHYSDLVSTRGKYNQAVLTIDQLEQANLDLIELINDQEARHNEEITEKP